jgi:hypothetical protein
MVFCFFRNAEFCDSTKLLSPVEPPRFRHVCFDYEITQRNHMQFCLLRPFDLLVSEGEDEVRANLLATHMNSRWHSTAEDLTR